MSNQTFYHNRAQEYFEQTFSIDPAPFLQPLTWHLAPGSTVLDVACGSGRDMLWLHKRGYSCSGLEGSKTLSELARKHTGLPVIEADIQKFDFSSCNADALLLIGALVHETHDQFATVFGRILPALQPQGLVLLTLKQGQGKNTSPDGRTFYLWEKDQIIETAHNLNLMCIDYSVQVSQVRKSDTWMSFILHYKPKT